MEQFAKTRTEAETLSGALPALLAEAERVASTVAQGVHGRRRVGVGETFWQFRRYEHGDAASSVDWRQSAKSGYLYVRQHEWEAATSVWIWRDASLSMTYRSHLSVCPKLERANLLALAVASLLLRAGERVAPLIQDMASVSPAAGRLALRHLARSYMNRAGNAVKESSIPPRNQLPRYAQLILLGDFLSPLEETESIVNYYAARGVQGHLLQILDPAEEMLPFTGRTEFEGVEQGERVLAERAESLRPAYQAQLRNHRETLATITRRLGWSFATHRTDQPPTLPLLALYGAISGSMLASRGRPEYENW